MPEIEIVPYTAEYREQVLQVQRHLWSRDLALNRAYLTWKYEDNPYLPSPTIALAIHRGTVVGMRGLVGARWQLGTSGRTIDMPFADDLVVAPEHRGQGISARLIRATCGFARGLGHRFVLNLRGGPMTVLDSLAAGFRPIGAMQPVAKSRPQDGAVARIRERLGRTRVLWRLTQVDRLRPASDRRPFRQLDRGREGPSWPAGVRVTAEADPAAMATLSERLPRDERIRHVHDRQYFDWVFSNPRLEYRFLYLGGGELDGYLVLHRERAPASWPATVWIVDWESASDPGWGGLLEAAAEGGVFARLAVWTGTLPDAALAALSASGFEPTDLQARARGRPAALIWPADDGAPDHPLEVEGRRLDELAAWRFRMLDQD